jgi:hypothetical protein
MDTAQRQGTRLFYLDDGDKDSEKLDFNAVFTNLIAQEFFVIFVWHFIPMPLF